MHNASLCPDLGYYYEGNDVQAGAQRVLEVIDRHDADHVGYRERQRTFIGRYLPENPTVVAHYAELLDGLIAKPAR